MTVFPSDHAIGELRGVRRMRPNRARRMVERRVRWLETKVQACRSAGEPWAIYRDELAALAELLEVFDNFQRQGLR